MALQDQIGERLAEDAGELEAVAGEAGYEEDIFVLRMPIDEKMFVGRHGVEANASPLHGPAYVGKVSR